MIPAIWTDKSAQNPQHTAHKNRHNVIDICRHLSNQLEFVYLSGQFEASIFQSTSNLDAEFRIYVSKVSGLVERTSEDLDGMLDVFVNVSSVNHEAPPIRLSELEICILDPGFPEKSYTVSFFCPTCRHFNQWSLVINKPCLKLKNYL